MRCFLCCAAKAPPPLFCRSLAATSTSRHGRTSTRLVRVGGGKGVGRTRLLHAGPSHIIQCSPPLSTPHSLSNPNATPHTHPPDLYIPLMAVWSYALLVAVAALLRSAPGANFKPDTIYNTVSGGGIAWLLHALLLKVILYSLGIPSGEGAGQGGWQGVKGQRVQGRQGAERAVQGVARKCKGESTRQQAPPPPPPSGGSAHITFFDAPPPALQPPPSWSCVLTLGTRLCRRARRCWCSWCLVSFGGAVAGGAGTAGCIRSWRSRSVG